MMFRLASTAALLLAISVPGQFAPGPSPVLICGGSPEVTLPVPDGVGGTVAARVLRFDPDGDMLHDLAIQWVGGKVTFCCAPEVLLAFADLPVSGVTGMTRIPSVAMGGGDGRDGLLLANGSSLTLVTRSTAAVAVPGSAGFATGTVVADSKWQHVVRVDAFLHGGVCWVLGLQADLRTVQVGVWTTGSITPHVEVVAANDVQEMLMYDVVGDGSQEVVVARTTSALELWTTSGGVARPAVQAPTASAIGALTVYNEDGVRQLAWLVREDSHWLLKTVGLTTMKTTMVTAPSLIPDRFRPLGLASMAVDGSSIDALVMSQSTVLAPNTVPWQVVLTRDPANQNATYAPGCAFQVTDLTYPTDTCPPLVEDITNDGIKDYIAVVDQPRAVKLRRSIPTRVSHAMASGGDEPDDDDPLPVTCEARVLLGSAAEDTLEMKLQVPAAPFLTGVNNPEVQIVTWVQQVANPQTAPYGATAMSAPIANSFYALTFSGSLQRRPVLQVKMATPPNTGNWTANTVHYYLIRYVSRSTGANPQILWSSPAQVVAFVMETGHTSVPPADLNFLYSISDPQGPAPVTPVHGNRSVGLIHKPPRIKPPTSTIAPPATGQGNTGTLATPPVWTPQ